MLGRHLRRGLAVAASAGAVVAAAGCGGNASPAPPTEHFVSRPDLRPPVVTVLRAAPASAEGDVFIAPKQDAHEQGPEILDPSGRLVWFHPGTEATDFRVQTYRGRPVLTWWQGPTAAPVLGTGRGTDVIMDASYHVVARVSAGGGPDSADLHEFQLTPRGTALLTEYRVVRRDLTAVGGPADARVADSVVEEVDVSTGRVLFRWDSIDHVPVGESYAQVPARGVYDYFHVNSVAELPGGNLLISARNTWALYDVDRRTGAIVWRLGGKRSDFALGPGTRFAWQHDARWRGNGVITLFDDGAAPAVERRSRALRLRLDLRTHRVALVQSDSLPGVLAASQGDVQQLPDGDVFVGWGAVPRFTEFAPSGRVVFDATFSKGDDSYRAYRFPWTGTPTTRPSIAVQGSAVYASWNGATQVARWRVLAGEGAGSLQRVGAAARQGFETKLPVRTRATYFAVEALDARGRVLGRSAIVPRGGLAIGG